MPGKGNFTLTGQIGDVMRESAQAALSLMRSRAKDWKIPAKTLREVDIHIHVPAGGIPKDGPSAGVAMLTALVSLMSGKPADPKVGMTGEITLRGRVLPIGGVKSKVLAAHRAGLTTVVLPERNEPDLHEVPEDVREALTFVFADRVEEVLGAALGSPWQKSAKSGRSRRSGVTKKRVKRSSKKTVPRSVRGRGGPLPGVVDSDRSRFGKSRSQI
jgi:ATP-dependent Lon protease